MAVIVTITATRSCSIDGCDRDHHSHGLCSKHALQVWRRNAPTKTEKCVTDECETPQYSRGLCRKHYRLDLYRDAEMEFDQDDARFWSHVDVGLCWVWTGAVTDRGYGCFWNGHRMIRAHVWTWTALVGGIPEGLQIDHLCRNTSCVNPDHLEPVTQAENLRREHAARAA